MKSTQRRLLASAIAVAVSGLCSTVMAQSVTDAIITGKVGGTFNLRYEGVKEDNAVKDASALTLRSALKYTTGTVSGWSAMLEMEDVSIVGINDYTVGPTGFNPGKYSVIADPESTEVNQAYLQYNQGAFTARLGRQDLRYDNQRFVGAVPWRQDFQTFDALTLGYKTDKFNLDYNYLDQRKRVFADAGDIDSKDHLFHGSVTTPIGALTGYAYLLEDDIPTDNALDTYGLRLTGAKKIGEQNFTYLAEFATQDYERGAITADADYFILEGGTTIGKLTAKLGYESLGSDKGTYGFSTPLATLHAFEGWADVFLATPAQGVNDTYLSLATPVAGGTFTFVYHDYAADESTPTIDDLGNEFDLQWTKPFKSKYVFGIKYADYSQGDLVAKVDKQIFWSWVQLSF